MSSIPASEWGFGPNREEETTKRRGKPRLSSIDGGKQTHNEEITSSSLEDILNQSQGRPARQRTEKKLEVVKEVSGIVKAPTLEKRQTVGPFKSASLEDILKTDQGKDSPLDEVDGSLLDTLNKLEAKQVKKVQEAFDKARIQSSRQTTAAREKAVDPELKASLQKTTDRFALSKRRGEELAEGLLDEMEANNGVITQDVELALAEMNDAQLKEIIRYLKNIQKHGGASNLEEQLLQTAQLLINRDEQTRNESVNADQLVQMLKSGSIRSSYDLDIWSRKALINKLNELGDKADAAKAGRGFFKKLFFRKTDEEKAYEELLNLFNKIGLRGVQEPDASIAKAAIANANSRASRSERDYNSIPTGITADRSVIGGFKKK